MITTLSNENMSLLTNMAKNAELSWNAALSAALAEDYKPHPRAYLNATELLNLELKEILMVATHPSDLRAAAKIGLRTAHIIRPFERGSDGPVIRNAVGSFGIFAEGFIDLAEQLNA